MRLKNQVIHGNCLKVMKKMPAECISTIITDPPYALNFMGKSWDKVLPPVAIWREALRVAKPGCMMLVFGGTRTYHRLTCNIEDAGWEIRDCMMWIFGSGFPKSHNISKSIDKHGGKLVGWFGVWLKKWRLENNIAQKQISILFPSKTGGLTGCVANWELGLNMPTCEQFNLICKTFNLPFKSLEEAEREVIGSKQTNLTVMQKIGGSNTSGEVDITAPASPEAETWNGYGTALKPAFEPILVCMKPIEGTFAQNAIKHGVAGLNIDGGRIETTDQYKYPNGPGGKSHHYSSDKRSSEVRPNPTESHPAGRWPANVILDEDAGKLLDKQSGHLHGVGYYKKGRSEGIGTGTGVTYMAQKPQGTIYQGDSGGASRFFYCAKVSKRERNAGMPSGQVNNHPTVKPLALLDYLCKLTMTPSRGIVMDMFAGSGSLAVAAAKNGIPFLLIEKDSDSFKLAEAKVKYALTQYTEDINTNWYDPDALRKKFLELESMDE